MILNRYSSMCFLLLLVACSNTGNGQRNIELLVNVAEPDRIRFSGKGAGAGMMLMSSMGATGIAIGVAIDEGIGKDIADTAKLNNINFSELIKSDFLAKLEAYNSQKAKPITKAKIEIERYGFVVKGGDNDPTMAEYIIRYQLGNNQQWQSFHFPKNLDSEEALLKIPLQKVKENGQAIRSLVIDSLKHFKPF